MGTADVPVVMQRQVLVIQRVQRTVDVPLVQHIDTVRRCPSCEVAKNQTFPDSTEDVGGSGKSVS